MTVDFKALLSKKADDAKRPPIMPAGTWKGVVAGVPGVAETKRESPMAPAGSPMLRVTIGSLGPGEDVDPSALTNFDYSRRQLFKEFLLGDDHDWMIVEFAKSCGINTEGRSIGDIITELNGADVLVDVIHRPNKAGTEMFANVGKVVGTKGQ